MKTPNAGKEFIDTSLLQKFSNRNYSKLQQFVVL
jgi:hypothetical protein